MVIGYASLWRSAVQARYSWLAPLFREHLVPLDVLSMGFRLQVAGLGLLLVAFPLYTLGLAFSIPAASLLSGFSVAGMYMVLVGKLACLFSPVGRRLIAANLALFAIASPGFLVFGDAALPLGLIGGSGLALVFLDRLIRHFGVPARTRYRVVCACYGLASLLATCGVAYQARFLWVGAGLAVYAGMWVYLSTLRQVSRRLVLSAKPIRFGSLLRGFGQGLRSHFRSACCGNVDTP